MGHRRGIVALNPAGRRQTKKHRPTIKLAPTLGAALRPHTGLAPYVQWNGKGVASVRTAWRLARQRAGLPPDFIPKVLRHTMATRLREASVPDWEAAAWMGHRVLRTTERYARHRPDFMAAAAAVTESTFGELAKLVPELADLRDACVTPDL